MRVLVSSVWGNEKEESQQSREATLIAHPVIIILLQYKLLLNLYLPPVLVPCRHARWFALLCFVWGHARPSMAMHAALLIGSCHNRRLICVLTAIPYMLHRAVLLFFIVVIFCSYLPTYLPG